MQLERRTILITGGGSGIGLALARLLADSNTVIIAGRDEAKLAQAKRELPALVTHRLDVTSEEEARAVVERLAAEFDGLDLLVNNAGLVRGYPLDAERARERIDEDVAINVVGAVRMTRLALPLLEAASDGGVVFMSSAVALAAVPGFTIYAATKAAVHSFARSLRAELNDRVRVFEVLPPVVDTGAVSGLAVPKVPAEAVARALIDGVTRNRHEIRVASIRQLAPLSRFAPTLADRLVTRALTPPSPP